MSVLGFNCDFGIKIVLLRNNFSAKIFIFKRLRPMLRMGLPTFDAYSVMILKLVLSTISIFRNCCCF